MIKDLSYWELRKAVSKIVPRMTQLVSSSRKSEIVREKGRKKNYSQFNLRYSEWRKQERLLNTEEINSFLEISVRAAACPMPFNVDVWDGLICIAKGQHITTKRGLIPIEEIIVGDVVLSYNETTKNVEWKPVINTSKTIKKNMIELETDKGILKLTEDHRVSTQRGWVKAGKLSLDDILLGDENFMIKIKSIKRYFEETEVYDISVKDNHNFFAEGVLVHNCPFNCIYCFIAGTKILMVDGSEKVIERILVGDRIMSFNEKTKRLEPAEVLETMKRPYKGKLICIETEEGDVLKMTPEHPIYTKQRGWVEAQDLKDTEEVLSW